jgi:hypothetical protein
MLGLFVLGICVAALSSCTQMRAKQPNGLLDGYLGRPVAELALRMGPPTEDFDAGSGQHAFQWLHQYGSSPGVIAPMGSALVVAGPQQRDCRLSVVATTAKDHPSLGDWIIQRYTWTGNGCL